MLYYWSIYILVGGTLATWATRLVLLNVIDRIVPTLRPEALPEPERDALPRLSLCVAAKDEAGNIEACLRSLLAQDYPNLQIICIDDRSSDATPEIVRRLAAEDPRLTFERVTALPDGWFGKNNAMRRAVELSTGDWLCFTDADCLMESRHSLATSVRHAMTVGADFLSILPEHEAQSRWERIVQPACSAVMMLWFSPIAVNRGRVAYANGAFMLMRRSCYEAMGGHAAVRQEINEDIHLARRARAAGQRLVVTAGRGLYSVRMYDTFARLWAGWTRIFAGSFAKKWHIVRAIVVLSYFTFLPWSVFALTAMVPSWRDGGWTGLTTIAAASCFFQLATMSLLYRLCRISMAYGILYPFGAVIALGTLLNAIKCAAAGGSFTWRGTRYRNGVAEPSKDAA
ncbi:MAG: glycosyltransferase [Phycisphaerales bacterium]|nr:glycosyltransferase [Phycisphaerales bacterium]